MNARKGSYAPRRLSVTFHLSSTQITETSPTSSSASSRSITPNRVLRPCLSTIQPSDPPKKLHIRRCSIRQLADMDRKILAAAARAAKRPSILPAPSEPKLRLSRIWTETEAEIDSLKAAVLPKRSRLSILVPSQDKSPIAAVRSDEVKSTAKKFLFRETTPRRRRDCTPKIFVNLPMLPFGKHKSYNEEKDIRKHFVEDKARAWRRKPSRKKKEVRRRRDVTFLD